MKRYLSFISALMIGCITLVPVAKVFALGEEPKAVVVSPEDAAKKYPMPKGKDYPAGINANKGSATASGFVQSPYSSRVYDAWRLGQGTVILVAGVTKLLRMP